MGVDGDEVDVDDDEEHMIDREQYDEGDVGEEESQENKGVVGDAKGQDEGREVGDAEGQEEEMGMDVVEYMVEYDSVCDSDRAQAKTTSSLSETQVLLGRIAQGEMKIPEAKNLLRLAGEVQSKSGEKAVEKLKRLEVVLQQRLRAERERAEWLLSRHTSQ